MLFYLFRGRNAARACRHFGIIRQTFYRRSRRFDRHDLSTLEERSHCPRKIRQLTYTAALAERVLAPHKEYPCWGKDKLLVLLARGKLHVSVSMVGRILIIGPQTARRIARTAHGPLVSLNTGLSSILVISWRSTPKRVACAAVLS